MLGIAEELSAGMLLKEAAAFLTPARRLFGLHHIHLSDPLTARLGRKKEEQAEIEKRRVDTKEEGKRPMGATEYYRGRGGGGVEVRGQCAAYLRLYSLRDEPGVNEGVKNSTEGLERRILSDVKQLQRWDANLGSEPLLKNAVPPPALIFI